MVKDGENIADDDLEKDRLKFSRYTNHDIHVAPLRDSHAESM